MKPPAQTRDHQVSVNIPLRNSDDRTEFPYHILENVKEGNLETLKNERENENAKNFDTDLSGVSKVRKLMKKGEEKNASAETTTSKDINSSFPQITRSQQVNDQQEKLRCCQS